MSSKNHCTPVRTMEMVICEKLKVLREFYVINNYEEEKRIRADLSMAIRNEPYSDMDSVADRFARTLISEKLA